MGRGQLLWKRLLDMDTQAVSRWRCLKELMALLRKVCSDHVTHSVRTVGTCAVHTPAEGGPAASSPPVWTTWRARFAKEESREK